MIMRFFTQSTIFHLRERMVQSSKLKVVLLSFMLGFCLATKVNAQTNSFTSGSIIGTTGDFARNAKIADFDNDGDNDIAFYSDGGNYRLYKNSGTGSFSNTYTELIPFGSAGGIIEPADLDGDGDIDIVASNGRIYINNGSGTFSQLGTLLIQQNAGGGIAGIKIADINSDGKKDIIWANYSNGTNAYNEVWLNTGSTGNAAFTYSTGFASTQSGKFSLDVADIDADGDLDVVLGISNGSAEVFKNNGGTFSLSSISGGYSNNVYLRDWDLDGDLDLLTWSSYNGSGLKVYLNNGSGTFGSLYYTSPISGSTIDIGDLNGDGYIDAAISNGTGGTTSILINNGCSLVERAGVAVAAPHGVVLGDVSGDGKLDIFIMSRYNTTTNQSRVYLNDLSLVSIKTAPGNALNFDGIDDYVSIPDANNLDLTSSYTIEAWIKPSSFSSAAGIVSKYHTIGSNGYLLRLAGTAPYTGINFDGLETATGILQADRWYHIAAVKNGSTRTLYINGVSVAMPNGSAITTAANTDVLAIGVDYLAAPRYFNGAIDEVRIWNTARTSTEVNSNRNAVVNACSVTGLVAYYKCDNGTASGSNASYYALNDLTTNSNNGILTNFSLTGTSSNWIASTAFGNTWLGTTSNAFGTTTNWSFGTVPTTSDNIVIPTGASNMPISITGTQAVGNLTVNSGASLTVTGTLQVAGSISNSGTLTAASGTIELNGSTAQTIPTNTFASNTVQNLKINNNAGVTLDGTLTVTGILTPTAGVFTTGGNLTLASSATGTASIAAGTGTYISGTVNVQRYSQAQRGYRALANPYTTAQSVSQLTDNFQVTGLTNGALGTYGLSTGSPSAFIYDGSKPAGSTSVLGRIYNADSLSWPVGKGLYAFIRGNGNEGSGGSYASSGGVPSAVTIDVTNGTLNQGNVTVSVTPYASGQDNYTLVANPYPCPINLSGVTGISSFGTIYLYNPVYSAGAATVLRGGFESTSSNNIVIPSMGCFYIQSTASTPAAITFHESDKVASGTPSYTVFGTGNQVQPKLVLELSTADGFMDKATLVFDNTSNSGSTDFHDAAKLSNNLVDFYSLSSDNKALAIDYRSDKFTDNIPLGIQTNTANQYTITVSQLNDMPSIQLILRDKLLHTETLLTKVGDSYTFNISVDTVTKGNDRFEIGLLGTTVLPTILSDFNAQLQAGNVAVNWVSTSEINTSYYNVQRSIDGSTFSSINKVNAKGVSNYSFTDNITSLTASIVYYRLQIVDKDGSSSYSKIVAITLPTTQVKALNIYPNPVQNSIKAQVIISQAGKVEIRVIDMQGKIISQQNKQLQAGANAIAIDATSIQSGNYILEIISASAKQQQAFTKQ